MIYINKILPIIFSPLGLVIIFLCYGILIKKILPSIIALMLLILLSLPIFSGKLTKILEEKRAISMQGNKRAIGNVGGDQSNLIQYSPEVQRIKNAKIKRAKELHNQGYQKTEILRMIIKEFKLDRNINSRSWPKWLSEI